MELVVPLQFSVVQPNLYRGSYPREINFQFIETLNLKSILSLIPSPITNESDPKFIDYCKNHGIKVIHIPAGKAKVTKDKSKKEKDPEKKASKQKVKRKQKPVPIEYDTVIECIKILVNKKNYPCYIHGINDNDMVISLVVACLRKFSYWSNISILNEFLVYNSSINIHERNFIEKFNSEITIDNIQFKDRVSWIHSQSTSNAMAMLPKLKFQN